MAQQIVSAYFGDEKSFRNITQSLINKIADGTLDITADETLIPVFDAAPQTKLEAKDEKLIREEAVRGCGSESDQRCIDAKIAELSQAKLKDLERTSTIRNAIKGRRLTVTVADENGRTKTLVAPDGQKFKLENVTGGNKAKKDILPDVNVIYDRAWKIALHIINVFVYVFAIAAVYAIFMRKYETTGLDSFKMIAYACALVSAFIPYSGYIIILLYFGFNAFINEYAKKE
jgi:hypothetical protein